MREAGLVTKRIQGAKGYTQLRKQDVDRRFPGPRWVPPAASMLHRCRKARGRGRATDAYGVIEGLTHV